MTTAAVETDPASRSAVSWSTRYASLKSRQLPDDDPRVRECLEALAFHRVSKVLDAETGRLGPEGVAALTRMLEHAGAVA
jgi:hypothetical protein